jgi:hypothetical protein
MFKQSAEYFAAKYRAGESANWTSGDSADDESSSRGPLLLF